MRKFYQNKLWRDKLIKMREDKGATVHTIPLAHAEYGEELSMKLIEEANGVYEAETHQDRVNEIVDVLESIDCILAFYGIEKEEIMRFKNARLLEFGSYTNKILVDYVEYPVGSEEEKHCLDNPESYPELCDDDEDGETVNNCCSNK